MTVRSVGYLVCGLAFVCLAGAKNDHELGTAKGIPDAVSKDIAPLLQPEGYQVSGPKGVVCSIWLMKSLDVKPGFKPTLNVKYPFTPGELIGVLQVAEKAKFTDFRGQEIKSGVYTLRYGKQPEDGNHVGTSEVYDFLLAVPAKDDVDPKTVDSFKQLAKMSAKASGGTHPAIFSLLPTDKAAAKPDLTHDSDHDHWVLNATTSGKADKIDVPVGLRLVVVGVSGG